MAIENYYPEMGHEPQQKSTIHARYSVGKYSIKSKNLLPPMRGLELDKVLQSSELVNTPKAQAYAGWYQYYATRKAFEKLGEKLAVNLELLLD